MPIKDLEAHLVPYAQRSCESRGRRYPETEHRYRTIYQRDRDRIIHCRAFRRLEYKTQVFVNHEGDHFRTRLTHSIEVSQIGRTVARFLGLNEDLVESLALSHDLGHTPFGHLGEQVLNDLLRDHGGFNHNRQSLRIVEMLEERYAAYPGLNLSWEVREGIAKHSEPKDGVSAPEFLEYEPEILPPLETQMIDLVDEIAYNHHDIDDGLESGLLDMKELAGEVPLFAAPLAIARKARPDADPRRLRTEALSGMINTLVSDLIRTTSRNIEQASLTSVADVRNSAAALVGISQDVKKKNDELKIFLRERMYRHHRIERMMDKGRRILEALFERYRENPRLLPVDTYHRVESDDLNRVIADYIAGMTDRYATEEYLRLYDPTVRV